MCHRRALDSPAIVARATGRRSDQLGDDGVQLRARLWTHLDYWPGSPPNRPRQQLDLIRQRSHGSRDSNATAKPAVGCRLIGPVAAIDGPGRTVRRARPGPTIRRSRARVCSASEVSRPRAYPRITTARSLLRAIDRTVVVGDQPLVLTSPSVHLVRSDLEDDPALGADRVRGAQIFLARKSMWSRASWPPTVSTDPPAVANCQRSAEHRSAAYSLQTKSAGW
jgi:hypothetical protein